MKQTLSILAAWLHDIGKFAERANAPCTQNLEQEYCPGGKGHRHVLYTDYFIENILPLPSELEADRKRLAQLASGHHKPGGESAEEQALKQADFLSKGGDIKGIKGKTEGDVTAARLESVFAAVRLNDKALSTDTPKKYYALRPLAEDNQDGSPLFPVEKAKGFSYAELYKAFVTELRESLPVNNGVRQYLASLAILLEKYTWCIPCEACQSQADISLYDHAATTAAIVQALLACPDTQKRLLLVGGEISGTQKYIFDAEGSANKSTGELLRARSVYLQALTRSAWLSLLDQLDLSWAARIMDAGGRFTLLLPDTPETRTCFDKVRSDIEHWLITEFQCTVCMNFASISLAPEDLERERFHACINRLNDALERAKLKPFATSFGSGLSPVLPADYALYDKNGECAYCKNHPATEFLGKTPVCPMCLSLIQQVMKPLPTARYLVFTKKSTGLPLFCSLNLCLAKDSVDNDIFNEAIDVISLRGFTGFSGIPEAGYCPTVTQDDVKRWKNEGRIATRDGRDTISGESITIDAPKTFPILAEEARIPYTAKKFRSPASLAACKTDVDNFGLLFDLSFEGDKPGESHFSVSHLAMFSRMMSAFFAWHMPHLVQREFPNICLVSTGDDEFFYVGPWSDTVLFSLRLQEDFAHFVGNNSAITFSAGLIMFKPYLSMHAMLLATEDALKKSKNSGKNAATLFGVTATWEEFRALCEEGQWLEQLCLNGTLTQAFVRRLLGYSRECREFTKGKIAKGLYLSHMEYDMARNCNTRKIQADDLARLKSLGQQKIFSKAEIGISWSLYRTRLS